MKLKNGLCFHFVPLHSEVVLSVFNFGVVTTNKISSNVGVYSLVPRPETFSVTRKKVTGPGI